MADIIVRLRADITDPQRQSRLSAFQGLNLAFLSHQSTNALSGGSRYSPMTSPNFSSKFGSLDSLTVRVRCGFISLAAHMRWTLSGEIHASAAPARVTDTWLSDLLKGSFQCFGRQGWIATASGQIHQALQTQLLKTLAPTGD